MSPSPACPSLAAPRAVSVVNADIRQLAGKIGLTDAERAEMAALWAEYARATARERDAA